MVSDQQSAFRFPLWIRDYYARAVHAGVSIVVPVFNEANNILPLAR